MKVKLVFNFTDEDRRAIANHYGQPGLATHKDIRGLILSTIDTLMEDLNYDLQKSQEEEPNEEGCQS